MHRLLAQWLLCTAIICHGSGVFAQQHKPEAIYRFDPALNLETRRQTAISAGPKAVIVIEKTEDEARVLLRTDTAVAPYLGAERGPELSPDELRLLADTGAGKTDYQLEAGIGLYVKDRARLNLGYRLQEQPMTLLTERRHEPFTLTGDLRVTFDLKVPFD